MVVSSNGQSSRPAVGRRAVASEAGEASDRCRESATPCERSKRFTKKEDLAEEIAVRWTYAAAMCSKNFEKILSLFKPHSHGVRLLSSLEMVITILAGVGN